MERLKVLKAMSEVKGRLDLNEFARIVGLTPPQTVEGMQKLVKAELLRKIGGGFSITETGREMLKAFTSVPDGTEFRFYAAIGQPTGTVAKSFIDFYTAIKQVDAASLEFHLYRGDFENWVQHALNDAAFAEELAKLKKPLLKGETLREAIIKATEAKYGLEKLQ